MDSFAQIRIERIGARSPHLQSVKNLADENSGTLGFFPAGAFDEQATRGQILVALHGDKTCIAYLLYRVARNRAFIVHLCVDGSWRSKGIAKLLVDELVGRTSQYQGIGLWCRRDYDANKMWPKLGFAAWAEKLGRKAGGSELAFWWRPHPHTDLFSASIQELLGSKLCAVIDASIFFDLGSTDEDEESEESKYLTASWLHETLELCLTDEIFNEIQRCPDANERRRQQQFAHRFTIVPHDAVTFENAEMVLRGVFPDWLTESDESDLRQLAKAIATGQQFFVTRDVALLKTADKVLEAFAFHILTPTDLIVRIDELRREAEYQPARIAGTLLAMRLVHAREEPILTDAFQCAGEGETKTSFQHRLRRSLATPSEIECLVALDCNKTLLALIAYRRHGDTLEIPLIRVRRGSLAMTMARHLILRSLLRACSNQQTLTRVTDSHIEPIIANALTELLFVHSDGTWVKASLDLADTKDRIAKHLHRLSIDHVEGGYLKKLADAVGVTSIDATLELTKLEKALWPAKIVDANIPCFIIPIRANWAQHLFDEHLAKQELFGAREGLALNREAVYYRSKSLCGLRAPARILWYVSKDRRFQGAGAVRASSYLDSVMVGRPKDLFRQFRRLGIYEWRNVYDLAKRNINNDVMAIRFSDTELLPGPIEWAQLQTILRENGCKSQIRTITTVTNEVFAKLYVLGKSRARRA